MKKRISKESIPLEYFIEDRDIKLKTLIEKINKWLLESPDRQDASMYDEGGQGGSDYTIYTYRDETDAEEKAREELEAWQKEQERIYKENRKKLEESALKVKEQIERSMFEKLKKKYG